MRVGGLDSDDRHDLLVAQVNHLRRTLALDDRPVAAAPRHHGDRRRDGRDRGAVGVREYRTDYEVVAGALAKHGVLDEAQIDALIAGVASSSRCT